MSDDGADRVERWTSKRRMALVLSIVKGETSAAEAARKHGLTIAEIEGWKDQFLLGGENALRSKPKDEEALKEEEIKKLKQKIGDLVMDMEILKTAVKPYRPFAQGTPEE
jgi:transposase-like protein